MGCFPDKKSEQFKPTKENEKKMKKIFKHLREMHEESENENYITLEAVQFYFIENPQFAQRLLNFMAEISFNQKVYKKHYLQVVETLMSESFQRPLEQFSPFSKFEVYCLIVLGITNPTKKLKQQLKINYNEAIMIIEIILRMFLVNSETYNPNYVESLKNLAINLVDSYFVRSGMKLNQIMFKEFSNSLQEKFLFIDYLLDAYYQTKFMNKKLTIHLPQINNNNLSSELLDPETIKLFIMVNRLFSQASELKLIYSNKSNEIEFKQLYKALKKFNGPTLILFEHLPEPPTSNFMQQQQEKTEIFGAFSSTKLVKSSKMQGDYNTFLFKQSPQFLIKQIQHQNYQQNPKPCYLNKRGKKSKDGIYGLGFGGEFKGEKSFKLWIDQELQDCQIKEYEQMFQEGNLIMNNESLNIQKIEVWGITMEPTKQIFELTEQSTEELKKSKINSDRQIISKVPPIMVSSEIMQSKIQSQPEINNQQQYQQPNIEIETEFRPKSSIFKRNAKPITPQDDNTKKIIDQLLEEHSYRLSKSQLMSGEQDHNKY